MSITQIGYKKAMGMPYLPWEGPLHYERVAMLLTQAFFGEAADQATPEALYTELLRIALWEQSASGEARTITNAKVSTRHVLGRARILREPFSREVLSASSLHSEEHKVRGEDELGRHSLDDLAEQGDVLPLQGGFWLPAPLRLVPISSDLYLLVGGDPHYFAEPFGAQATPATRQFPST